MFKHWMKEMVRGVTLVACALILALSAGEVAQSSGFGACMAALRDDVLSLLGVADGDPTRTRVNESGALWTVDSDLADMIVTTGYTAITGEETSFVLPTGTRAFSISMIPFGVSVTPFVTWGTVPGSRGGIVTLTNPTTVYDLDIGAFGGTIYTQPGGGSEPLKIWYTVSQNPD